MLFSNKRKETTNTCYITDESQKRYAKRKKTDTRDHILYDSIHMMCPEKAIYRQKVDSWLPGPGPGSWSGDN